MVVTPGGSLTVTGGASIPFQAAVNGTTNQGVKWSVITSGPNAGSVVQTGPSSATYFAPTTILSPFTATLVAQSSQYPSVSGTVTLQLASSGVSGILDPVSSPQLSGWVKDSNNPGTAQTVNLLLDGAFASSSAANLPRADVSGNYGYATPLPGQVSQDALWHALTVTTPANGWSTFSKVRSLGWSSTASQTSTAGPAPPICSFTPPKHIATAYLNGQPISDTTATIPITSEDSFYFTVSTTQPSVQSGANASAISDAWQVLVSVKEFAGQDNLSGQTQAGLGPQTRGTQPLSQPTGLFTLGDSANGGQIPSLTPGHTYTLAGVIALHFGCAIQIGSTITYEENDYYSYGTAFKVVVEPTPSISSITPAIVAAGVQSPPFEIKGTGLGVSGTVTLTGNGWSTTLNYCPVQGCTSSGDGSDVVTTCGGTPCGATLPVVGQYTVSLSVGQEPDHQNFKPQDPLPGQRPETVYGPPVTAMNPPTASLTGFDVANSQVLYAASTYASNGTIALGPTVWKSDGTVNAPFALVQGSSSPRFENVQIEISPSVTISGAQVQVSARDAGIYFAPSPVDFVNGKATVPYLGLAAPLPGAIQTGTYAFTWSIRFNTSSDYVNFQTTSHQVYFVHSRIDCTAAPNLYCLTTKRLALVYGQIGNQPDAVATLVASINNALITNPGPSSTHHLVTQNNIWAFWDSPTGKLDCESLAAIAASWLQQIGYPDVNTDVAYPNGNTDASTQVHETVSGNVYSLSYLGGNFFEGFAYLTDVNKAFAVFPPTPLLDKTTCTVQPTPNNQLRFRILTYLYKVGGPAPTSPSYGTPHSILHSPMELTPRRSPTPSSFRAPQFARLRSIHDNLNDLLSPSAGGDAPPGPNRFDAEGNAGAHFR